MSEPSQPAPDPIKTAVPFPKVTAHQQASVRAWVQMLRTYTKGQHRMAQIFRRYDLTSPQFDVLATLHRGEGLMQQELASRLLVTKGNIVGVLDRLEASGWIERRPDPDDRRANAIYLTAAGRKVFAEVIPIHHAMIHEMMADFPIEDLHMLRVLLKNLEEGINK